MTKGKVVRAMIKTTPKRVEELKSRPASVKTIGTAENCLNERFDIEVPKIREADWGGVRLVRKIVDLESAAERIREGRGVGEGHCLDQDEFRCEGSGR